MILSFCIFSVMSRDFQAPPSVPSLVIDLTQDTSVTIVVDGPPVSWEPLERLPDGGFHNPNAQRVTSFQEQSDWQLPDDFTAFGGRVTIELEFVIDTNNVYLFGAPGGLFDAAALTHFALEAGNGLLYENMALVCEVHIKKRYRRAGEYTRTIMTVDEL